MRFKIVLNNIGTKKISINYQHFLSSTIYDYLQTSNIDFSLKLHSGLHIQSNKSFKFFTFSWLQIPDKKIINSELFITSPQFYWFVSSPWDEFIHNFTNGLLERGELRISKEIFSVIQVETLSDFIVNFEQNKTSIKNIFQKFSCLSPIVLSTKREHNGKLQKYYYRPTDSVDEISEKLRNNILNKYRAFYNKEPENTQLKIIFDSDYIQNKKAKVLVHYIKGKEDIKISAIMCPFTADGSAELIKLGYECGFGELNSAGFGMIKLT